jgi:hypothetical protein
VADPTITYSRRQDASQEAELSALAAVYRFILGSHKEKEAAPESRPDAGKEINERSGKVIIPK